MPYLYWYWVFKTRLIYFSRKIIFASSNVPLMVCSFASNDRIFLFPNSPLVKGPIDIMALTLFNNELVLLPVSLCIISKKDLTVDALVKIRASTFFCFNREVKSFQLLSMLEVNTL